MSNQEPSGAFVLEWGKARAYDACQTIPLWWQEVRVDEPEDIAKAVNLAGAAKHVPPTGLYAFEGSHDGSPGRQILYIGQCGAKSADGTPGQALATRLEQSFRKLSYRSKADGKPYFFSDIWDLKVRFAHLDAGHILSVEALLILAHAPSFNSQRTRGELPSDHDYLILNGGRKGMLLQSVASLYYRTDCWPGPPQME